jgi:hypothetical protein
MQKQFSYESVVAWHKTKLSLWEVLFSLFLAWLQRRKLFEKGERDETIAEHGMFADFLGMSKLQLWS